MTSLAVPAALADAVRKRYKDAYAVAGRTVSIGNLLKWLGAIAAGLIVVAAALASSDSSGALVVGIVLAPIVWFALYNIGVSTCARGQILLAQLDGAVYASPFLTDDQRIEVMSLIHTDPLPVEPSPQDPEARQLDWPQITLRDDPW